MIIRVKKNAKDRSLGPKHRTYSRREFIERGICTTTLMAALPHTLLKEAFAGTGTCPVAAALPGGVAQIHGPGGGFSIASYILNMAQLNMATAGSSAANLWGITGGSNLVQCFSNAGVDQTSPFGNAILTPPPGISATQWTAALKQCSWGFNFGTAAQDDGGGEQLGHIGAVSPIKASVLNTDISINPSGISLANWATGLGSINKVNTSSQNLTSAALAKGFGITPSTGTTQAIFTNSATAAASLGSLFSSIVGGLRSGAATSLNAASCGFQNDSQMASSTYGTNLFTPSAISTLANSGVTLTSPGSGTNNVLTAQEQAFLAAYYESNVGQIGGVVSVNPGADYHNQSVQQTIAPYDQNMGIQVRMWLLAAMLSGKPSAMIISTNGTPGPDGTQNVQISAVTNSNSSTTVTVNGNSAQGDDGGSFSGNGLLIYSPTGTPPALFSTGTIKSDGAVTADTRITSVPAAIASHYFTALSFLGFSTTQFSNVLAANGITPVNLITG